MDKTNRSSNHEAEYTNYQGTPCQKNHRRAPRQKKHIFHWGILTIVLAFFAIPLVSLALYTIRRPLAGTWTTISWQQLFGMGDTASGVDLSELWNGVAASVFAAALTVAMMLVILVPTLVITRLYSKKLGKIVEFLSLLPLAIPAIALVVGLGPIYRIISQVLSTDAWWLAFAYTIIVLPYSYRSLDAGLRQLDVITLFEAAQTFGASWIRTLFTVVIPNLKTAIISACFISVAVVFGEYTIAALLGRNNLQTALFVINQNDSFIAAAMALLAMLFAMLLLIGVDVITTVANRSKSSKK
ncbi:MAG: ABC transporter permease subunit [Actinomycetaceae bacterium]|nr:ABC transporter permease subunit [Arcanobacterium sp.]MDD7686632.1 ABC transporter permease subunit [Actinomycetaceae bacterium]MDY5273860.1 ABC transporter permease subunit [Arcanobacterium sp.]